MRLASLSKPTEAIPTNALPRGRSRAASRTSPTSIARATPSAIVVACLRRIVGDPEHAREVVAAPSRKHPEDRARDRAQRVGDRADRAVAAEHDDDLSASRRLHSERASVVEIARVGTCDGQPSCAQSGLRLGREAPPRPPPAAGLTIRRIGSARTDTAQA